jgi:nucleoside-diphosphate-sugar epimerase
MPVSGGVTYTDALRRLPQRESRIFAFLHHFDGLDNKRLTQIPMPIGKPLSLSLECDFETRLNFGGEVHRGNLIACPANVDYLLTLVTFNVTSGYMKSQSAPKTILVTGGNGYLGSWIVKLLLAEGHTVNTTVRNLRDKSHNEHLDHAANKPGRLTIFEADLIAEGSYDKAMAGCEIVIHSASPFAIKGIEDAQKELIDPAVNGTKNVLGAVDRTPSVKRVVLTSSVAAIYGDATDLRKRHAAFSEEDWNTTSTETYQPYPYSKTLAEREAWRIARAQTRWDLVVLNPSFILGPALNPNASGVSQTIMRNFGDGTFKNGMVDAWYGFVDVRDAAQAHLNAAFDSRANGRYILSGRSSSLLDVAAILRSAFGTKYPIPKRKAPKIILWLLPRTFGFTRRYVTRNVGVPLNLDNRRSLEQLNVTYRPLETTVLEHFQQLFGQVGTHSPGITEALVKI